jgi:hypothetical protein
MMTFKIIKGVPVRFKSDLLEPEVLRLRFWWLIQVHLAGLSGKREIFHPV